MDAEFQEISQFVETAQISSDVEVQQIDHPEVHCALCQRLFPPDNELNLETLNICGDCKVMFLEDLETTIRDSHQRRPFRGRRAGHSSSESIEDLFSHQFSHLINLVQQNQHSSHLSVSEHEIQQVDGDTAARVQQRTSSRTTPSGSRRWRFLSDNENEGFDQLDSVFGDSESNVSFGRFGVFHGESDAVSFSAYGGESDASMDGHSFLDREMFVQLDDGSDYDSYTDIDPMHAGLNQWNTDEQDEEDGEWEEANAEVNTIEASETGGWIQGALTRSPGENNNPLDWLRGLQSVENGATIQWSFRENRRMYNPNIFANLERSEAPPYIGNSGDYLDGEGFEQLLEQLAEADSIRQGAPPAAASFVEGLPCVIINEEHEKHGGLICAVCKDYLSVGTEVNQLPCTHLYHPSCILPWLRARNSCPLCRYELPTDDKDYEEGKGNAVSRTEIQEIQQEDPSEDISEDVSDDAESYEVGESTGQGNPVNGDCSTGTSGGEDTRGRWLFLAAAAPIVSLVGVVLVLWFRNPLVAGRGSTGHCGFRQQGPRQQVHGSSSSGSSFGNKQRENSRRWWSLF